MTGPGSPITHILEATERTFSLMLGETAGEAKVYTGDGISEIYAVSAIIGLGGEQRGAVVMSCPVEVARTLTLKLLAEEDESAIDDRAIADAVGEIVNVIAGSAKPGLRTLGYDQLSLSLPTVVMGGGHRVFQKRGVPSWLAMLDSPFGCFAIQVYLGKGEGESGLHDAV